MVGIRLAREILILRIQISWGENVVGFPATLVMLGTGSVFVLYGLRTH